MLRFIFLCSFIFLCFGSPLIFIGLIINFHTLSLLGLIFFVFGAVLRLGATLRIKNPGS